MLSSHHQLETSRIIASDCSGHDSQSKPSSYVEEKGLRDCAHEVSSHLPSARLRTNLFILSAL